MISENWVTKWLVFRKQKYVPVLIQIFCWAISKNIMSWISETLCAGCVESKRKEITQQKKGEKKVEQTGKQRKEPFKIAQ